MATASLLNTHLFAHLQILLPIIIPGLPQQTTAESHVRQKPMPQQNARNRNRRFIAQPQRTGERPAWRLRNHQQGCGTY